jgi:hypothetical protein
LQAPSEVEGRKSADLARRVEESLFKAGAVFHKSPNIRETHRIGALHDGAKAVDQDLMGRCHVERQTL